MMADDFRSRISPIQPAINEDGDEEVIVSGLDGQQCSRFQSRYVIAFMAFFGFFNCMTCRASFNVSLVAMVNFTASEGHNATSDECPGFLNASADQQNGDFDWGPNVQSMMLGSFYYGYILTQFPGGYLAERFGSKIVFGLSVFLPGVLTLLIPTLARWHPDAVVACRILMGLIQGPIYPSNQALWGKWAPLNERSRMLSFSTAGALAGYVIAIGVSGILCDIDFLGGWPLPFYVFGSISIVWSVLWCFLGYSSPQTHPRISLKEKQYIESTLPTLEYESPPWRKIFSTRACWVIAFYCLMDGVGFYIFFSAVPIYMKQILKFDISQNGLLSAMPYLASFFIQCASGPFADVIRRKEWLTKSTTCKLFTALGEGGVAMFLIGIAFVDCNATATVILLTLGYGMVGFTVNGVLVNVLDMAPKFAGTIMGLVNPIGNIGGFVTPALVSAITQGEPSKGQWQIVFFMAAGVYGVGTLAYIILGDAREQPWARSEKEVNMRRQSEDTERLLVD